MSGSEGSGILTRYLPTETFRSLQGCSRRIRFLLGLNLQHLATSFDVKYAEHSNRENFWHTMLRLHSIRGLNWLLYMIGDDATLNTCGIGTLWCVTFGQILSWEPTATVVRANGGFSTYYLLILYHTVSIVFWNCLVLTEINVGHRQPMPAISGFCQQNHGPKWIPGGSTPCCLSPRIVAVRFSHFWYVWYMFVLSLYILGFVCIAVYGMICSCAHICVYIIHTSIYIYSIYGNPFDAPTCGCPFLRISSLWTINDTLAI